MASWIARCRNLKNVTRIDDGVAVVVFFAVNSIVADIQVLGIV